MLSRVALFHVDEFETASSFFRSGAKLDPDNKSYGIWIRKCNAEIGGGLECEESSMNDPMWFVVDEEEEAELEGQTEANGEAMVIETTPAVASPPEAAPQDDRPIAPCATETPTSKYRSPQCTVFQQDATSSV